MVAKNGGDEWIFELVDGTVIKTMKKLFNRGEEVHSCFMGVICNQTITYSSKSLDRSDLIRVFKQLIENLEDEIEKERLAGLNTSVPNTLDEDCD